MTARPLPPGGGFLLVDKPTGPTSHDVVQSVRRALGERRVGHTGTLDPFASGLLVLCVGPTTRLAEYLAGCDKEYVATLRLGQRTTTHDTEGEVVEESEGWRGLGAPALEEALAAFRGPVFQRPPRFSAKKVEGEAAYRRARRGEAVELEPVEVTVHELELLATELPLVRLRLRCSSGTYVRALARDLGAHLGVGAHLTELRRTRVCGLRVEDAARGALDDPDALMRGWVLPSRALAHLPSVTVEPSEAERLAHGQSIADPDSGANEEEPLLVLEGGALVAVATREGALLRPRKVLRAASSARSERP